MTDASPRSLRAAFIDELVTEPWQLEDDGMLAIPSGPGLGITINPEALAAFSAG